MATRVMVYLGLVSYGIFLWNLQIVGKLSGRGAGDRLPIGEYWSLLVVGLAVTTLVASGSWYLIEKPALSLKGRVPRKRREVSVERAARAGAAGPAPGRCGGGWCPRWRRPGSPTPPRCPARCAPPAPAGGRPRADQGHQERGLGDLRPAAGVELAGVGELAPYLALTLGGSDPSLAIARARVSGIAARRPTASHPATTSASTARPMRAAGPVVGRPTRPTRLDHRGGLVCGGCRRGGASTPERAAVAPRTRDPRRDRPAVLRRRPGPAARRRPRGHEDRPARGPVGFLGDVARCGPTPARSARSRAASTRATCSPWVPSSPWGTPSGWPEWLVQRLFAGALLALAAWGTVRLLDALLDRAARFAAVIAGLLASCSTRTPSPISADLGHAARAGGIALAPAGRSPGPARSARVVVGGRVRADRDRGGRGCERRGHGVGAGGAPGVRAVRTRTGAVDATGPA